MKMRAIVLALGTTLLLSGCQNMDSNGLMTSGAEAFQAYSLSDAQVKALSDQACKDMDGKATLAPANSTYTQRLNKIASALGDNINGQPVNYKVYVAKDVNAFAMANGCIRVYSGLMDMMTDNEVEAVIGHEMGHVALGLRQGFHGLRQGGRHGKGVALADGRQAGAARRVGRQTVYTAINHVEDAAVRHDDERFRIGHRSRVPAEGHVSKADDHRACREEENKARADQERERDEEIRKLEKQMQEASRMLEFEYAAVLRDRIIELRKEQK